MTGFTPEMIEKAKAAKSAEELLALAKDNGVEMTVEEATAYFSQLNPKSGELDDDELDSVAGGGCHSGDGRLIVSKYYECELFKCAQHGKERSYSHKKGANVCYVCEKIACCDHCAYMSYEDGLWLCNHQAYKE